MFFGLIAINDHPCCKMQAVVEEFFRNSINAKTFSINLFPTWIHDTIQDARCKLDQKFSHVHTLLYSEGMSTKKRTAIADYVSLVNNIEDLCGGKATYTNETIDWDSDLGNAIDALMCDLYNSLDLAIFRRNGITVQPTRQLYVEFIKKNKSVCPFCGLSRFKNPRGARREDFDHYLPKRKYPLSSVNFKNLIPACGICNQDYKKTKDILEKGTAFYPYSSIPEIKITINCIAYPAVDDFDDGGSWSVNLLLTAPNKKVVPKLHTWDRVYSIKKRIQDEIQQFFHEWMTEISDDVTKQIGRSKFRKLILSAKEKAQKRKIRRIQPGQIVKEAFYDFILNQADESFVESFRTQRNAIKN